MTTGRLAVRRMPGAVDHGARVPARETRARSAGAAHARAQPRDGLADVKLALHASQPL
jgi:hypothetical protein